MKSLISVIIIFFVISPVWEESITLKTKEGKQSPVQFSLSQTNSAPTALYISGLGGKGNHVYAGLKRYRERLEREKFRKLKYEPEFSKMWIAEIW